jgi:hypothetical protein
MPQEIYYVALFVMLVIAAWPDEGHKAREQEAQDRLNNGLAKARHRYLNVITPIPPPPPPPPEVTIRTVRHKISGKNKGTGFGGATVDKS